MIAAKVAFDIGVLAGMVILAGIIITGVVVFAFSGWPGILVAWCAFVLLIIFRRWRNGSND